jgi:hypothetical protein
MEHGRAGFGTIRKQTSGQNIPGFLHFGYRAGEPLPNFDEDPGCVQFRL